MATILLNKIRIGGKAPTKIMKGSIEVKCVYKGSTLVYDIQKSSTQTGGLYVSFASSAVDWRGATWTPNISKYINTTPTGYSGNTYSTTTSNFTGTVTLTATGLPTGATFNSSTGAVTFKDNNSDSVGPTVTVKATATIAGKSYSASDVIYQISAPGKIFVQWVSNTIVGSFYCIFSTYMSFMDYSANWATDNRAVWISSTNEISEFGNGNLPEFPVVDGSGTILSSISEGTVIYCIPVSSNIWANMGSSSGNFIYYSGTSTSNQNLWCYNYLNV